MFTVKMQCITAFCLVCLFVTASGRVNYCGSRMCGNTNSHTFCQFSPGPGADCSGYIDAQLTRAEKTRLLARLNRRRNDAAVGRLRGLPSAGDMLKLRWIEELAKEAQLWANQCRPPNSPEDRDECRDLFAISVGQCVASVVGEAPGLKIESMVDMWYMQSLLYKGNVTTYIPSDYLPSYCGDFGQMMWSRSYMVGCGRSRFMIPWQGRLRTVERLVCNFSPAGPPPYRPLWSAAVPATACPPRSHPDETYKALCNYQFKMVDTDIVDTMPIEEHVLLNSVLEIEINESLHNIGNLDELYLTNLAIVTMDNFESTTPVYISIQKRDIVEAIGVVNFDVNNIDKQNELKTTQNPPGYLSMNSKIPRKKISMVGRPKTYRIAELTENRDDFKEDNDEIVEDVPKNFNVNYGDYVIIVDTQEENETTFPGKRFELKTDLIIHRPSVNFSTIPYTFANKLNAHTTTDNFNITINASTTMKENVLRDTVANTTELEVFANVHLNETLTEKEKSLDYLTDSETVRELQKALEHMENEMQTSKITAKVRRELSESSAEPDFNEDNYTTSAEPNTSTDKSHMLNMVLDYLPYLKQYQGEILGTSQDASNSVGCVYPSVILVMFVLV